MSEERPDLNAVRAELFESAVGALVDAGASEDDARRMLAEIAEKFRADLDQAVAHTERDGPVSDRDHGC